MTNTLSKVNDQAIDHILINSRSVMERSAKGERLSIKDSLFDVLHISISYDSYMKMDERILKEVCKYLNRVMTTSGSIPQRSSAASDLAALYAAASYRNIKFE